MGNMNLEAGVKPIKTRKRSGSDDAQEWKIKDRR